MNTLLGRSNNLAFFGNEEISVVLDTKLNLIVASGASTDLLNHSSWVTPEDQLSSAQERLANRAIAGETEKAIVAASGRRMYSIPTGVQKEAEKALAWRKEFNRGGTPVGVNSARTLAKGGQLSIQKVRHIAKYFPRHEVDKKAKGYEFGEDGYPSNGRIAWALWGGDAGQRWASTIVERENKKAIAASGVAYRNQENLAPESAVEAFRDAYELEDGYGPEFMVRVNIDGSGMDRLYKIDADGELAVWDDDCWDTMGSVYSDLSVLDADVDESMNASGSNKTHILIDPASAVYVAACLAVDPYKSVSVSEIDEQESRLVEAGLAEEDWELINRVMTAAGEPVSDGEYTPDERSENASEQPRDATGKFVKLGTRTIVGNDVERGSGVIDSINQENGKVKVRLDSGKVVEVTSKYTTPEAGYKGPRQVPNEQAPLDVSGILAEPRTPSDYKGAQLPGTMKPMSQSDVQLLISDWASYVKKSRESYKLHDESDPLIKSIKNAKGAKGLKEYDKKYMKKRNNMDLSIDTIVAAGQLAPNKKDVAKYLAIVSPDDPRDVLDLVVITPTNGDTIEPTSYKYVDGKWESDPQIIADISSATPPPVVLLDDESLKDVISQLDDDTKIKPMSASADAELLKFWGPTPTLNEVIATLLAAGGADRNRGNADALRRYWTRGKGALKIRWGTPGDWTRCVRQLSKYMGPRAKGYCQLRHKEVTGVYTGSKKNVGKKKGRKASAFSSDLSIDSKVIDMARLAALAADAREKVSLVASARADKGANFYIPMLVPEEVESGDGREFEKGAISTRELPVPLMWQIKTGQGHDGSVVVGRIDHIERLPGGMGNAYGVFDTGPYGREAERLVRYGFLRGVSVDLDKFEAKENKTESTENAEDGDVVSKEKLTINKARIMAATIVAKPAFQECSITLLNDGDQEDTVIPEDGVYEESLEDFVDVEPIMASGFLKADIPMSPPADWFANPKLSKPTPLTVDDDGRVYGHIAAWNVSHIGLPRSTKPPRSRSKYAYFNTGVVRTEEGTDVPVGQLTLAGGHAPLNADAASAAKHYDDTASAVADIQVGEDEYGIWCAGSLRPGLEEMQIRALRASAPSGDWRPINGSLELVAICQVNVPGFPTARAMIAGGKLLALVAAGASYMAALKCSGAACALSTKAELLGELASTTPDLRGRVKEAKKALREANIMAITASAADLRERALVASAIASMSKISDEERIKLAKKGQAMPDGAYPIRNVDDLKNAIQAYGRAKDSERRAVRKHITKQARALKSLDLIPAQWMSADSYEAAERVASMRQAITAAGPNGDDISDEELEKLKDAKEDADQQTEEEVKAAKDVKAGKAAPTERDEDGRPKYESGVNQPRDAKGKYRKVLARLKQDLGVAGLAKALKKAESAENLDFAGDYRASAEASGELIGLIDRLDSKALNPKALENVRLTAAELGKTIANLPLPFGLDAQKLKFSDLPSGLKDLIDSMITRVEAKIGKKDADIATQSLKSFMSGSDLYSQAEVQSEMSKLLRLLT
jgi:hypothetical protein